MKDKSGKESEYLLNGPPVAGRLLKFTDHCTPVPSGPAVAEMEPLTLP